MDFGLYKDSKETTPGSFNQASAWTQNSPHQAKPTPGVETQNPA